MRGTTVGRRKKTRVHTYTPRICMNTHAFFLIILSITHKTKANVSSAA